MLIFNFITPNDPFLRFIRGCRALRAIKLIPHFRQLEVVVNALLNTMKTNVIDVLILLLLAIFVFGVSGHYLYGSGSFIGFSFNDWNSLDTSFYTLWVFVCADGWTPYQDRLDKDGWIGSQVFTCLFIFLGNFIIANLFIGVICQNIEEATNAEKKRLKEIQNRAKLAKREIFLRKQRRDISQLLSTKNQTDVNFQQLIQDMVGTIRHEDVVPMTHMTTKIAW